MEYGEYCWYSSWTRSTPNLKINNPSKIWRGLVPIHKFFLTNQILNSYRWIYMEGKIQKFPISCHGGKKVVWSRKLNIFFRHRYILNETLKEKIVCMHQLFLIREPKNLSSNSWCDVRCPGRKKVTVKYLSEYSTKRDFWRVLGISWRSKMPNFRNEEDVGYHWEYRE